MMTIISLLSLFWSKPFSCIREATVLRKICKSMCMFLVNAHRFFNWEQGLQNPVCFVDVSEAVWNVHRGSSHCWVLSKIWVSSIYQSIQYIQIYTFNTMSLIRSSLAHDLGDPCSTLKETLFFLIFSHKTGEMDLARLCDVRLLSS